VQHTTASDPEVVTFGETMALFVTEPARRLRGARTFARSIAGAESNVAIGLARLGRRAGWFGRVGDDPLGHALLDTLRGEGVDTSRAVVDADGPTGVLIRDRPTERRIDVLYYRAGSAGGRLAAADVDADYVVGADLLHVTGITPALGDGPRAATRRAVEVAREHGVAVSFDPNLRTKLWDAEEAARVLVQLVDADVVLAGLEEAEALSGRAGAEAAAGWFLDGGADLVVVKLGVDGAWATDGERSWAAPAHPVTVVDPVGAGDAFAAGFVYGLLDGRPPSAAVEVAHVVAARALRGTGDWETLPRREELF
jgi:2-dehydro-3-deoxygluconokinase